VHVGIGTNFNLPFFAIGNAASKREALGRTGQKAPIDNKRDV